MDYKDLIKNRRSIRNFTDKKVPVEILHDIIQDTILAPSACDLQPWRFIIIQNVELMKRISDDCKKNILEQIRNDPTCFQKKFENTFKNPKYNIFYNANTLVLICSVEGLFQNVDCSLAASYFMFAATERNIGTCWIAWGKNILDTKIKEEIGLSKDLKIIAPLIVGYPAAIPPLPKRKPVIVKEVIS